MAAQSEMHPVEWLHAQLIHDAGGFADAVLFDLSPEKLAELEIQVSRLSGLVCQIKEHGEAKAC